MIVVQTGASGVGPASAYARASDIDLVEALRGGDESAFVFLLDHYQRAMMHVAALYLSNPAVVEEVVQETWLAVFQRLRQFEGRCSLKTWIFRILANRARTRGAREGRSLPFSAIGIAGSEQADPSVDPACFHPPAHAEAGHWSSCPRDWSDVPERRLLSQETRALIESAIAALPASQRTVISLRDVEGWTSGEVCQALSISENNQRVLLHRARSKVRQALEPYFAEA